MMVAPQCTFPSLRPFNDDNDVMEKDLFDNYDADDNDEDIDAPSKIIMIKLPQKMMMM